MQKITPFLWFNNNAEEAVNFYVSVFKNSKTFKVTRYGDGAPIPKGTVQTVSFNLDGVDFVALNGGPIFNFTPAISFVVNCNDQDEIDYFWEKLSEGGEIMSCGWLKDKFGVAWQIVPIELFELMSMPDKVKTQRVMTALYNMIKIDIETLRQAYEQGLEN